MNKYSNFLVIFGVIMFFGAPILYWYQFSYQLELPFSKSQEVWGQMGDFLGGVLNPALTFINVFLLINSLNCQLRANENLENQIEISKKNENLRTFESSFFHLVDCQTDLFQNFKVEILENNIKKPIYKDEAVKKVEQVTAIYISENKTLEEVKNLYNELNKQYNFYEILRSFHVIISLIDNVLSDEKGFSLEDRKTYYLRLINITRFSNLILVCISVQFLDKKISENLKNHSDLKNVMKTVGLKFDLYQINTV
uniref:hypothetical protein n=1 Tax=Acinetobacter soli TaxID=487316 RepID=UPI003F499458